ncbi:MAG: hypothetical protein HFJ54_09065 [Clostridia bacterium]|nr:hypothetical protein [Clostridia bacterium]
MYNEKIDEIIYLLKNNNISDFIASLSLIVAIIAVIVTIIINVRENKKYINSLKPLLSFSLYEMNGLLLLLVKNNGQSEAKNIRIEVLELKNNGNNSKLMLDAIFKDEFMLYPTEETQGIIAISGKNIETNIFPEVKLNISFIEGNDNKKIEYCRTITFTRKMEEKDRLENIEDSIESISYSNNRIANYIEGRTLFTFDRMNVIPKNSLYKDMKDAFNNVEREDEQEDSDNE